MGTVIVHVCTGKVRINIDEDAIRGEERDYAHSKLSTHINDIIMHHELSKKLRHSHSRRLSQRPSVGYKSTRSRSPITPGEFDSYSPSAYDNRNMYFGSPPRHSGGGISSGYSAGQMWEYRKTTGDMPGVYDVRGDHERMGHHPMHQYDAPQPQHRRTSSVEYGMAAHGVPNRAGSGVVPREHGTSGYPPGVSGVANVAYPSNWRGGGPLPPRDGRKQHAHDTSSSAPPADRSAESGKAPPATKAGQQDAASTVHVLAGSRVHQVQAVACGGGAPSQLLQEVAAVSPQQLVRPSPTAGAAEHMQHQPASSEVLGKAGMFGSQATAVSGGAPAAGKQAESMGPLQQHVPRRANTLPLEQG